MKYVLHWLIYALVGVPFAVIAGLAFGLALLWDNRPRREDFE